MVKQGYKQTEIGVIPEDWSPKIVDDVIKFSGGSQPPLYNFSPVRKQGYVRLIQIRDYKTDKYKVYIPENLGRKFCTKNDIMIGRYGPPIFQILKGIEGAYNVALLKVIPNEQLIDKTFAWHFLRSETLFNFVDKLSQRSSGQTGVDLAELRNYPIPLPPLAEQEAIASALSDADAWIENLEELIAKKRLIKQGAMQTLLTPKDDWEVKKLGEVCDVRDGTHDSPKYLDSGVKFITSKNIVNNKLDFSDISYISFSDATEINKRSKVDKDDIIMSMIGTIGNAVLIDFEPDFCIKNVALLKPKDITVRFLIQMIKSPYFQNLLNSKMDGGIQKFVSLGVLRDLDFHCPKSLSEQERIARILSDMDAELEALEQQLAKARLIKQGMMQELLTGRTRLV